MTIFTSGKHTDGASKRTPVQKPDYKNGKKLNLDNPKVRAQFSDFLAKHAASKAINKKMK